MPPINHPATPYPWQIDFFSLAAIWGASFLFMHVAAPEFGPIGVATGRVGIAALMLIPLAIARGLGAEILKHWRVITVLGLFNTGIPFVCYAFALLYIPTGITSILNATTPMFTACVAWLWLGQRPGKVRLLGLLIGFTGVALLTGSKNLPAAASSGTGGSAQLLAMAACLLAPLWPARLPILCPFLRCFMGEFFCKKPSPLPCWAAGQLSCWALHYQRWLQRANNGCTNQPPTRAHLPALHGL